MYILLILCILFYASLSAQTIDWKNYTSFSNVKNMHVIDDTIYAATSGGLLAITDFADFPIVFQNLDGIGTNNVTDIIKDTDGQKWITGFGRLIKFTQGNPRQYLFFDNNDDLFMLNDIVDDYDYLWIATSMGLVLFSKVNDDGQIEDSYQLFGNLNPNPDIREILLAGDSIWIATSDGLAVADRSNLSLLKSPSNWTTFNMSNFPILESNEFMSIVKLSGAYYTANTRGVFKVDIDAFGDATFTQIDLVFATTVNRIQVENDTLFLYNNRSGSGRVDLIINDTYQPYYTTTTNDPVTGLFYNGRRWFGMSNTGLFTDTAGSFEKYISTGTPHNFVADVSVTSDGVMYAGFDNTTYAFSTSTGWTDIPFFGGLGQDATVTMVDSLGRPWMGTWGNGIWLLDDDTLINYDENNSSLRGNTDLNGERWVYTTGMDTDGRYVYMTSYRALNDYPVAIGDLDNLDNPAGWDSIGLAHGLNNIFLTSLDYSHGKVAVGTESDGVYESDVGDDPFASSKTTRHLTRENSLLIANTVRAVKYSPEGDLWVGTNFGLSRYDPGVDFFRNVDLPEEMSSDITAIEFDGRGNLWIGTPTGLGKRDVNDGSVTVYTTLNSGIVSDHINNITFDPYTGNIYIATDGGISVIPSLQGTPVFEVSEVLAFPNPFVIKSSSDILSFNFGKTAIVSIFTSAGERVITLPVNAGWDGKNASGNDVSSGVYLFLIEDDDGNVGKGKILLVRN